MPGVVSLELLLDEQIEAHIRRDWAALEAAGLSSLGAHRSASNRPHITMLVRPVIAPTDFSAAVDLLPITVALTEPVTFPHADRAVLAWGVAADDRLRELFDAIRGAVPPGEDAAHTAPGEWTPHVSLARRMRIAALPQALELLGSPTTGAGVSLRRWDSDTATVTAL